MTTLDVTNPDTLQRWERQCKAMSILQRRLQGQPDVDGEYVIVLSQTSFQIAWEEGGKLVLVDVYASEFHPFTVPV